MVVPLVIISRCVEGLCMERGTEGDSEEIHHHHHPERAFADCIMEWKSTVSCLPQPHPTHGAMSYVTFWIVHPIDEYH